MPKEKKVRKKDSNEKSLPENSEKNLSDSEFRPSDDSASPDESEPCDPNEFAEYKNAMQSVNTEYAVTMLGSDCLVLNEYWDPINSRRDIRFLTFDTFTRKMLNRKCVNPWRGATGRKYKSAGSMWLASGYRRHYESVLFDPSDRVDRSRFYNMFQGFSVKPEKGSWSILKGHIFDIICGGDENLDHYVLSWMARIVQDPGGPRPGTALLFRGVEGCGKGCVIRSLGKILFPHYKHLLNLSHLTGKFNQHLKDALLVFCDEITWGGDKQAEGILKGIITEPTVRIEPKMKDSVEIPSHINLAIASNNDWMISASLYARRFCVLDVLPDKKDDKDYFGRLYAELENGGYEAMLYDLLHYPRMSTKELCTVPRTAGLLDQIIQSLSPVHKFWFQRLCDGTLLLSDTEWINGIRCYSLYNSFLDFCDTIGRRNFNIIRNQFSRNLKEVCPGMQTIKKRVGNAREFFYTFPSLSECREKFQEIANVYINWDEIGRFSGDSENHTDHTDHTDNYS